MTGLGIVVTVVLFATVAKGARWLVDRGMADGDRFKIWVKDTGIGIKTEDMKRLFREFEQLEGGASRRYEGSGLGLALTKKLVQYQGGGIDVASEYGRGSTFSFTLPMKCNEGLTHE